MMKVLKSIFYVFWFLIINISIFSQNNGEYFVNDTGVRLRDAAGLSSQIIRILDLRENVKYLVERELYDGSDYKWINVSTSKGNGWIYGEFLSPRIRDAKKFILIEDAFINYNGQYLTSGMHESELTQILGAPISRTFDAEYNDFSLKFQNDLVVLVHKYNLRVHHIIIKNNSFILSNGISVGAKITDILNIVNTNNNVYTFSLKNYLHSSFYNSSVIITTNDHGIINEIQIGLPE